MRPQRIPTLFLYISRPQVYRALVDNSANQEHMSLEILTGYRSLLPFEFFTTCKYATNVYLLVQLLCDLP
jgi:hypothetical protein